MTRSAKPDRVTKHAIFSQAGRLLHALADAGNPRAGLELHLLLGPNGAQFWTPGVEFDQRQQVERAETTNDATEFVIPRPRRGHTWRRARTVSA